jgi:hypothetical protein
VLAQNRAPDAFVNAKRGSGYAVHRMPSVPVAGGNFNPSGLPAHDRFRRSAGISLAVEERGKLPLCSHWRARASAELGGGSSRSGMLTVKTFLR